jgi:hypothetical protein
MLLNRAYDPDMIDARHQELLELEAGIVAGLELRAALH